MCGIAVILGGMQDKRKGMLQSMLSMMVHRGPDGEGAWHNEHISLGHRRLSIIDPVEASNQPMISNSGRYVVSFNGEIYNYSALRNELSDYAFKTHSDTEVLLAGFEKWGVDVVHRLNGMFAFAMYDVETDSTYVFRDRMGIKPIYYYQKNGFLSICSELRPIIRSCITVPRLDKEMLVEFMRFQTVKPPNTLVKGVRMIKAGCYLEIKNGHVEERPYWEVNKIKNAEKDGELKQNIRKLLVQSVEERLISDVPLGSFLSGGVDSSIIVAAATKILGRDLSTYSVVFDEDKFDESEFSKLIAKTCGTDHHEIKLSSQTLLKELPDALSSMDYPSGDGINTYMISEAAKKEGVTVCLSGLGSDELFYGYNIFSHAQKLLSPTFMSARGMARLPVGVLNKLKPASQRFKLEEILDSGYNNVNDLYPYLRKLYSEKELKALGLQSNEILKGDNVGCLDWISALSVNDMKGYMEPILLRDADQMGMAHSLEIRVPFLDHRLVEYVIGIPESMKNVNQPKRLLIDAFSDVIPDQIWKRKKMGFTFPWELWLKNDLRSLVEANLAYVKQTGYFNEKAIDEIWNKFLAGDKRVGWAKIWILVVLGNWMNRNGIS